MSAAASGGEGSIVAPGIDASAVIHPTAIVHEGARIGANVRIGPYSIIGPHVSLGDDVIIEAHVIVDGNTDVGARCHIFPFAAIGLPPQDRKFRGEASRLTIGTDTVLREYVTINPGTEGGGGVTVIGDRCLILTHAHVAHDCHLGTGVLLVNNVMLAGHVTIGDYASLGGGSAVHQFVRIGAYSFLGGLAGLGNDLIPFGMAVGNRAALCGLNIVGLKRHGFAREEIYALRRAYRRLFGEDGTLAERTAAVGEAFSEPSVQRIVSFLKEGGDRSVCIPEIGARPLPTED